MLTLQAYRVLREIRKVQEVEGNSVVVSSLNKQIHQRGKSGVDFEISAGTMKSILADLEKNEYISQKITPVFDNPGEYVATVCTTHKANHVFQLTGRRILLFLLTSVVVPIIVAAITSVITTNRIVREDVTSENTEEVSAQDTDSQEPMPQPTQPCSSERK